MLQPRVIICLVLFSVVLYSCEKPGCTHAESFNYDPDANLEDGSCVPKVFGCMDTASINYVPTANTDDGSCIPKVYGCTNPDALNYNPDANVDDGSCDCNREMFYGTYDIHSTCFQISPNGWDTSYSDFFMIIYADSSNGCKVKIDNYFNYNITQSRFVFGNNILVPTQSSQWSGWITTYYKTIAFSSDTLYIHTSTVFDGNLTNYCDMIGIKQ